MFASCVLELLLHLKMSQPVFSSNDQKIPPDSDDVPFVTGAGVGAAQHNRFSALPGVFGVISSPQVQTFVCLVGGFP